MWLPPPVQTQSQQPRYVAKCENISFEEFSEQDEDPWLENGVIGSINLVT